MIGLSRAHGCPSCPPLPRLYLWFRSQRPDHFEITAEVPGFRKEDVKVTVESGTIQIKAERNEASETKSPEDAPGTKWHRSERRYGSLTRSFRLPQSCDMDHITARCENGVLSVNIPKSTGKSERGKSVPIA